MNLDVWPPAGRAGHYVSMCFCRNFRWLYQLHVLFLNRTLTACSQQWLSPIRVEAHSSHLAVTWKPLVWPENTVLYVGCSSSSHWVPSAQTHVYLLHLSAERKKNTSTVHNYLHWLIPVVPISCALKESTAHLPCYRLLLFCTSELMTLVQYTLQFPEQHLHL